eukprot:m.27142 g.27142  ORF g.27142 m.27142 type:complete len:104 (+) comp9325_c0_seq1:31-342(+)
MFHIINKLTQCRVCPFFFSFSKALLADEAIADVPICVLGNKIDIPGAASEDELRTALGLHGQTTGKGTVPKSSISTRPLELFMCSVLQREGYGDGFKWLAQYL